MCAVNEVLMALSNQCTSANTVYECKHSVRVQTQCTRQTLDVLCVCVCDSRRRKGLYYHKRRDCMYQQWSVHAEY